MKRIKVDFAVYGSLKGRNEINGMAMDVRLVLQKLIDENKGVVTIDNKCMGGNPLGKTNILGAQVQRQDGTYHFACQEGQTINFKQGGMLKR